MSLDQKKTAEELAKERMEQRLIASNDVFDSKQDLAEYLGGWDHIFTRGLVFSTIFMTANDERIFHNDIINDVVDTLRQKYGENCKVVERIDNNKEKYTNHCVFDKDGPLRRVSEVSKKLCVKTARHQLENMLDKYEFDGYESPEKGEGRDKVKESILSQRYFEIVEKKEDIRSKIIEFIIEEASVGYNFIIEKQRKKIDSSRVHAIGWPDFIVD